MNLELGAPFFEVSAVELSSIIADDDLGIAKVIDDGSPDELLDDLLGYLGSGFSFNPLGEVVDDHQDKLLLTLSLRERAEYIHPPPSEGEGL